PGGRGEGEGVALLGLVQTEGPPHPALRATFFHGGEKGRGRWRGGGGTEPGGEGSLETGRAVVIDPGDIAVGADEDGSGGADLAEDGKLPAARVARVDDPHAIGPWRDPDAAGDPQVHEEG